LEMIVFFMSESNLLCSSVLFAVWIVFSLLLEIIIIIFLGFAVLLGDVGQ